MTKTEDVIPVCDEETINEIKDRYLEYNKHANSYTWKKLENELFIPLDMNKTLEDNGLKDEGEEFYELGIDEDQHLTTLYIYFNDDLTYA